MLYGYLREQTSVFVNLPKHKKVHILEPSCGDGSFLAALETSLSHNNCEAYIEAVELDPKVGEDTAVKYPRVNFFNKDFLFWEPKQKFDLVIGNPPYIVRKRLNSSQAEKCKYIHVTTGLKDREVANIWTSFVIKSAEMLFDNGVLAFVLPTELLQVNYSKEIRNYLLKNFARLEIISFRNLAFEFIEQDTVILIGYKKHADEAGLYFSEASSIDELNSEELIFNKQHGDHDIKWSSYIFAEDEISFIKAISDKLLKVSDLCSSVAGIVTAANGYFILSQEEVEKYDLSKYVKHIIQKGMYVNGSAELLTKDYELLKSSNKPCYILDLNNIPEDSFTERLRAYLQIGEQKNIPERYKCKLRQRWFDVPSIWKSEGFFFKRGHHYPKFLVNKADVHVTDSAYRIKMKDGEDVESFAMSFYNSLTLLFSELNGRYYGGGVLEITPNEFKGLPIPRYKANQGDYKNFIQEFKKKSSIENFVVSNNNKVFSSVDGITESDISHIHKLYKKVKNRRLRRSV